MSLLHRALAALGLADRAAPAVRRTYHFSAAIGAPPERVFPLLCPIRENEWIEGWSAAVVHSTSGFAEPGALFRTRIRAGELWVTSRHEPESLRVEYVVVARSHAVLKMDLALEPSGDAASRLSIVRTYTGLDVLGRRWVGTMSDDGIGRENEKLARQLDHFARTGEVLRSGAGAPNAGRGTSSA